MIHGKPLQRAAVDSRLGFPPSVFSVPAHPVRAMSILPLPQCESFNGVCLLFTTDENRKLVRKDIEELVVKWRNLD